MLALRRLAVLRAATRMVMLVVVVDILAALVIAR
jgi:hypothetical protein